MTASRAAARVTKVLEADFSVSVSLRVYLEVSVGVMSAVNTEIERIEVAVIYRS